MGRRLGWEMGFAEKWSLATAWRVRNPVEGKLEKLPGNETSK